MVVFKHPKNGLNNLKTNKMKETLEEAAERIYPEDEQWTDRHIFNLGAKWQQQNSYSEEEVLDLLQDFANDLSDNVINIKFWFENFKKK